MRILVSGSHGLIGTALVERLQSAGHHVVRLARSEPRGGEEAVRWNIDASYIDSRRLSGISAVVHLAGEGIGDRRWTEGHKARVIDSRVRGTRLLAEALAAMDTPPGVLISASGVHFYGSDRGDEILTEESLAGQGFLSEVCRGWEAGADPARAAGIRVVHIRTAPVMTRRGGLLPRMLIPFRLGLGGRLGPGRQWWSWITLEDEIRAIIHLLRGGHDGPVNLCAPDPVTNADFTSTLGRVLKRPTLAPVPAVLLKLALGGEMAREMVFASLRVMPEGLVESGFEFLHPHLEPALQAVLSERS